MTIPRLRMFAGPNGSGKSTLKSVLPPELLGVYLNPDDIEAGIRRDGFLDCRNYRVETTADEICSFFAASEWLCRNDVGFAAGVLRFEDQRLYFDDVSVNSYIASVAADFLRQKLMEQRVSFSFETVMSHPDKIALLDKARKLGYRTYLYYVATDDPQINIARVEARVRQGGHDVPHDKIVSRYARSLDLLLDAIRATDRAYLFDNSQSNGSHAWIAEVTDGRELTVKCEELPRWFADAVWKRIL